MEMTRCYPTGCPPCDGPIDFPENPSDGQRYCIPIGSEGNTKCWVWDACIPAWRAEGPSESSTRFRGSLNITVSEAANGITRDTPEDQWQGNPPQPPVTDVAAGDWWILTIDVAAGSVHPDFRNNLAGDDYSIGDRIFYDGQAYERLAPPIIPFAEEAVDVNPLPDNRVGGITLNASLQDALAGTKRCDAITPYTLSNYVDQEIGKINLPTVNNGQLVITYAGNLLGTFTANQAANATIAIPAPPPNTVPNNATISIVQNGIVQGDFTTNQGVNETITLPNINNPTITLTRDGVPVGAFTLNQGPDSSIDVGSSAPTSYADVGTYTITPNDTDVNSGGQNLQMNQLALGSLFNFRQGTPQYLGGTWRRMGAAGPTGNSDDAKTNFSLVVRVS